jgi:hypothetical protein
MYFYPIAIRFLALTAALASCACLLTACSPQRLQSAQLIGTENGRDRYHMTGFTDLYEVAPRSSVRHIEHALSDACPAGVNVISLDEKPAYNGAGDFIYWDTMAECK